MDITQLLQSLLISILLVRCLSILILVCKQVTLQLTAPVFQLLARAHFKWRPDSQFGGYHLSPFDRERGPDSDVRPGVAVYEHASKESEEQVECAVCLYDIEVGEEIRELRCQHLFHRACLDTWLECPGATCPLCRDSLVPCKVNRKPGEEDMDDAELEDVVVPWIAFVHNAWGRLW